jgi:hypothetical protein
VIDLIGGRTRARTWDPLIKSQRRVRHTGYAPDFLFPDAGPSDALVMIVQRFTERWAQPVVIEFRSGANTETGARIVATNPLLLRGARLRRYLGDGRQQTPAGHCRDTIALISI